MTESLLAKLETELNSSVIECKQFVFTESSLNTLLNKHTEYVKERLLSNSFDNNDDYKERFLGTHFQEHIRRFKQYDILISEMNKLQNLLDKYKYEEMAHKTPQYVKMIVDGSTKNLSTLRYEKLLRQDTYSAIKDSIGTLV